MLFQDPGNGGATKLIKVFRGVFAVKEERCVKGAG